MNTFLRINAAIFAASSVVSGFMLPNPSGLSSSHFASSSGALKPLHMGLSSSFGNWDLPEDVPDGYDETSLMEVFSENIEFIHGDDLERLRRKVMELRAELYDAKSTRDDARTLELQLSIVKAQQQDAEFVYSVSLERMEAAESRGRWIEADQFRTKAMQARQVLPQFNLEGLWVGKYGTHGYEMINVTYVGDTIQAFKVTGDQNVPKGELSFTVDVSPRLKKEQTLEPVELEEAAALQWGAKFLPRFGGKGQVAGEGFSNAQFVEGQLILVNEFFSFAWVPIGHQIFFGRPGAELTLKLLRESEQGSSEVDKARVHLKRCMEETYNLEEEDVEEAPAIAQHDYYGVNGYFE